MEGGLGFEWSIRSLPVWTDTGDDILQFGFLSYVKEAFLFYIRLDFFLQGFLSTYWVQVIYRTEVKNSFHPVSGMYLLYVFLT